MYEPGSEATVPDPHLSARDLVLLTCGLTAVSLLAFYGSFTLPYYSDDFVQLVRISEYRAGTAGFATLLFQPHNEHTIPFIRLLFWAATGIAGFDAWPLRLMLVLVHASGAVACARLAAFGAGSRRAAWGAGLVYAGAAGYMGSTIWCPTCGVFLLGGTFLAWGLVAALTARTKAAALLGGAAALAASAAGLNGGAIAVASVLSGLWIFGPRAAVSPRRAMALFAGLAVLLLAAASANTAAWPNSAPTRVDLGGLPRGLWLAYIAPARFLASFVPWPKSDYTLVLWTAPLVWMGLAVALRFLSRRERNLLLALSVGPLLLMLLIGVGRGDAYTTLFLTTRYFYFALLPLALGAGFVLGRVRGCWMGASASLLLASALVGSHLSFLADIPWTSMRNVAAEVDRARALALRLEDHARHQPLRLTDGTLPFDHLHPKHCLTLSAILFTQIRTPLANVAFVPGRMTHEREEIQNRILTTWELPVRVREGLFETPLPSWLDFRERSWNSQRGPLVHGFWNWAGGMRWIGAQASVRLTRVGSAHLRLVIRAPVHLVHRAFRVAVSVNGQSCGVAVADTPGELVFDFPVDVPEGREVMVSLIPDATWRPIDVVPDNLDSRTLSVEVVAIGFPPPVPPGS